MENTNLDPLGTLQRPEMVDVHDYTITTPVPLPNLAASLEEIESMGQDVMAIVPGFQVAHALAVNRQPIPAVAIVFRSRTLKKVPKRGMPEANKPKLAVN